MGGQLDELLASLAVHCPVHLLSLHYCTLFTNNPYAHVHVDGLSLCALMNCCCLSDMLRYDGEQSGHLPEFHGRLTGKTSVHCRRSTPVCRGLCCHRLFVTFVIIHFYPSGAMYLLSKGPSVCHDPLLYQNGLTYRRNFDTT